MIVPGPSLLRRLEGVEGHLADDEVDLLLSIARRAVAEHPPQAVIVEVGSYCGRSTIVLASAAAAASPEARVYAIDPHEGEMTLPGDHVAVLPPSFERFRANIARAGLSQVVVPIRKRSYETGWKKPICLLFLDGLHDYTNVARDFAHFEPWLAEGAYVVLHDHSPMFPGVIGFVEVLEDGGYEQVASADSLVALRKAAA